MTVVVLPPSWVGEFERMQAAWAHASVAADPVPGWRVELARMQRDIAQKKAEGLWRTGKRTLLSALGFHHDEVIMCRGLAWLLTPDGWHGLGSAFLDAVLVRVGADPEGSGTADVVVEEARDDTRADLVIRFDGKAVLIEAKVHAIEQPTQCDRLATLWAEETPTLVFLTRDGKEPFTAEGSAGEWERLAWSDLADLLAAVIVNRHGLAAGVVEYLDTLRIYGGQRS